MRAIVIPADETVPVHDVQIPDDGSSLPALQQLVGGDIQFLPYPGRRDVSVFCNEEGKLHGLAANPRACNLMRGVIFDWDFIVGDVVICGLDSESGETVSAPDLPELNQL